MKTATWEDFGETASTALAKIQAYISNNAITIDAVVPIMRGGNFLGSFLAYKLNVLRILPVQYKYFFGGNNKAELRQLLFTPTQNLLPERPTLLVVEGDFCYGTTVKEACKDILEKIPNVRLLVAADLMDYSYRHAVDDVAEGVFYGRYTNHCEELTPEQCQKLGIEDFGIAPWENEDEEEAIMNLKQYPYKDFKHSAAHSTSKLEIDLSGLLEKWNKNK